MARLERLPDASIIKGLKGNIDFYIYNGQVRARVWPAFNKAALTINSVLTALQFAYLSRLYRFRNTCMDDALAGLATGTRWTKRDVLTRWYYGKGIRSTITRESGLPIEVPNIGKPGSYAGIPIPDPLGRLWLVQSLWTDITVASHVLFMTTDTPSNYFLVFSRTPPSRTPVFRVIRGLQVFCGYDLAWNNITGLLPFNQPGGGNLWNVQIGPILDPTVYYCQIIAFGQSATLGQNISIGPAFIWAIPDNTIPFQRKSRILGLTQSRIDHLAPQWTDSTFAGEEGFCTAAPPP